MFKKITKLMLAMLMAFSIMPISVSAEDYDQEEVGLAGSTGKLGDVDNVCFDGDYLYYPLNSTTHINFNKMVYLEASDLSRQYLTLNTDYRLFNWETGKEITDADLEALYSTVQKCKYGIKGIGKYSGQFEATKNGYDYMSIFIYDPYDMDPDHIRPYIDGKITWELNIPLYSSEEELIKRVKFVREDSMGVRPINLVYGKDYEFMYMDYYLNIISKEKFFSNVQTPRTGYDAIFAGNIVIRGIGEYHNAYTLSGAVSGHEHTLQYTAAKAATCKTKGNVAYYSCTDCGAKFSDKYCQKKLSTVTLSGTHNYNVYGKCSVCSALAKGLSAKVSTMKVKSISKGKGYLTVKWAKNTKVKGYQVRYSLKSNMSGAKTVTISKYKTTSKKIKSLKKKTTYYVQIRAFVNVNGKKMYSTWSAVKSAKTK